MSDLIERLRKLVILDEVGSDNPLGREAADEIERLRAELAEYKRKAEMDYAVMAGDNALIKGLKAELRRCRAGFDAAIAKFPLLAATEYSNGAERNTIGNLRAELGVYREEQPHA